MFKVGIHVNTVQHTHKCATYVAQTSSLLHVHVQLVDSHWTNDKIAKSCNKANISAMLDSAVVDNVIP